jgi:coenzyme F420 hydrogenase subunit beta
MQPIDDKLISYNILKQKIIDKGFCTLCGACVAACPPGALIIEKEKVIRLHDCSKDLDLCPICYEICPHSEALLLRALQFVSDAPKKSEALGYYRKIVLAQAADPKLREKSRGGGVAAALLEYGVQKKIFGSTTYSQAKSNNTANAQVSAEIIQDDTLSAVENKFFIASVAKTYGSAIYGQGKQKVAYVGIPCHVLALRKMEAWQHKVVDSVVINMGLFCFGVFSLSALLEHITKTYNILPSEIKKMRLSSDFVVETTDRTIRIPISEVEDHLQNSCRTCMDFTAELSDISFGAAYPLIDWSTVIIRTKAGEDFFYDAEAHGVITTKAIEQEPTVFELLVKAGMQKRTNALHAAKSIEKACGYRPVLLLRESEALAHIRVEDIMTKKVENVPHNLTITQLLHLMAQTHHIGYPVQNDTCEVIGFITLEEAAQVHKNKRDSTLVSQIICRKPVTVQVGETALDAFKKMSKYETGRVLVIDPADSKKILGLITKTDLMHTLIDQ